ncbi:MAG: MFS transporter [Verrucomicrobia bacterium]|nr:MFS transporter [Verrucomicrobiota bacterium]
MNSEAKLWTPNYILFCSASLIMFFAFYSTVSTLPIYLDDYLHAEKSQIGLILSSYALAAVLLRPFCGYALDSWGRKNVFMSGFLVFSCIFGMYALSSIPWMNGKTLLGISLPLLTIGVVRFMHGLSWAFVSSGNQTISVDIVPPSRRGEGIAYFGMAANLSMAVGPALGLGLINFAGSTYLFITTMILSLVSFISLCFMKFPVYRPQRTRINLKAMVEKTSIPFSIVCAIFCFSNSCYMTYMPIYSKEIEGANPAVFFFVYSAGMIGTRFFSGRIFDRIGPMVPVGIGFPMMIAGSLLLWAGHSCFVFYLAALLLGIGSGMAFPSFVACINNMVKPTRRGAANATFSSAIDIGIASGIISFGFISDWTGLRFIYFLASGLYVIAFLFYLLMAHHHYQRNKIQGV